MRKKRQRFLSILLFVIIIYTLIPAFPISALAVQPPETASNERAIDIDGDGIVDEYIYYDETGMEIDHYVVFNADSHLDDSGDSHFGNSSSNNLQSDDTLLSMFDEAPKHAPEDPVPSEFGGNPGEVSLAFYPTYGDWVYDPISASRASLIAYMGTATDVVIPDNVDGYTVVNLSSHLFARSAPFLRLSGYSTMNPHAKFITSVTIPDTVISVNSFLANTSVVSINLPSSVNYIYGLGSGSNLAEITVSPDNLYFLAVDGVLYDSNLTQIESYPPKKLNTVYTLPNTLFRISSGSFSGCSYIEAFAVRTGNEYFSVTDGVLYNKAGTELIRYPMGKPEATYISPVGVSSIASGAFNDTVKLNHIVLSEGVRNMVRTNYINKIQTITLPSTLIESEYTAWSEHFNQIFELESITVAPGNPVLTSQEGILYNKEKTILHAYPINKSGFYYTIPEGLLVVERFSFFSSRYLAEITIPASLTDFNELPSLCSWQSFKVDKDNDVYTAVDGVLYTKDMRVLVAYPSKPDLDFVVPDGVEYITTINTLNTRSFTVPQSLKVMDAPGISTTRNESFRLYGNNNYARRWANYFGIAFAMVNITAAEIQRALVDAADIIAGLHFATHDTLYGRDLETISNIIEDFEALTPVEKAKLTGVQIIELEEIRTLLGEINHTNGNVSIIGAPWNIRVEAVQRFPADPAYNNSLLFLDEGLAIEVLYDIRLTRSGLNYNLPFGQSMTVIINGDFASHTVSTVRVFHLKSNYTTEYIRPLTVTSTSITFNATSFSPFSVVSGVFNNVMLGDVNGDERITITDVTMLYFYVRSIIPLSEDALAAADVSGDGRVTITDVTMVYQYVRNKVSSFQSQ